MAEFEPSRKAYRDAVFAEDSKRSELIRERERVKRLTRRAESLSRRAGDDQSGAAARLGELRSSIRAAREQVERLKNELASLASSKLRAFDVFATLNDPTKAVARLPDDVPIALFPLRLETRFKTITQRGIAQTFLWVRVFPDDALVDAFQPEISEAEYESVANYWVHYWRAGGVRSGRVAAWAQLVRSHGGGRAKWLTDRIPPTDRADEPEIAPGEHILVIRTTTPVPAGERAAIGAFWARVWSTRMAERDAAFAVLESALGRARAAEVEADLEPVNLRDPAVKPTPDMIPRVAYLNLPDPETLSLSQSAWTRGARAWLLPERLVLVGFRGGAEVLREVGNPIPSELQVGPDPATEEDEQIAADGADLEVPDALRWTVDFEHAVAQGMGFVVNLTARGIDAAFDRLFVLGVRVGSDAARGATELSELITRHQASRKGFSLLPQGRATNNTDTSSSGYSWWENPEDSFVHFFEADESDDPDDWRLRKDGAWLAGLLGIDRGVLRQSPRYYGTDQAEARAMNAALFPATLGYYMDQMLEQVFSEEAILATRDFFNRFVIGRGTTPLVRIGKQPYGILPTTVWSKMAWWRQPEYARSAPQFGLPASRYAEELSALVGRAVGLWTELARGTSHVGAPGPDPQRTLLDILGLHPTSAELYQRYAQSFAQHYHALGFSTETVTPTLTAAARRYVQAGLLALSELGWTRTPESELPELLKKIFLGKAYLLRGDVVETVLSETASLTVTRADGLNYIAWLEQAARTSHDALRKQEGFPNAPPTALLYLWLHHALDLGFIDAGWTLKKDRVDTAPALLRSARREPQFLQVSDQQDQSSAWELLYRPEPEITGDPLLRLGDHIPKIVAARRPYLQTQLEALDVLAPATTAALERAFVEHIDCLSYRLDAWRLGLHAAQLSYLRQETVQGFGKGGIYVGAYGWLERVVPKSGTEEIFTPEGDLGELFAGSQLLKDSTNLGHIHAPSLDHAVTAAILRNGHVANRTPSEPDLLAVDLSSERVRLAHQVIEGIRNGQSLGALLGYRLERALHDQPNVFLDRLIYDLRRAFPLAGNRNLLTKVDGIDDIATVEARNVLDGAAFAEHLNRTGVFTYPYALTDLPELSELVTLGSPPAATIGTLVDGAVAQMRSVADAVADIAVAEGVYQVVRGNYDRAGASLDGYSKGTFPPLPEVSATPRSGRTLTHRVVLHLEGGLAPTGRPRSKGEPALARWIATQLPPPSTVVARVRWTDPDGATDGVLDVNMAQLGLAPVDLFYLLDSGGARDMAGFDELLIDHADTNATPRPRHDAIFSIEYKPAGISGLTLFELAAQVRALRGAVLGARPLALTDLSLQNEASVADSPRVIARLDKVQAVKSELEGATTAITSFLTDLEASTGDIDGWIPRYATIVRAVTPFGLQAASLTTGVEGRRRPFTMLIEAMDALIERWEGKQTEHARVMADYAALPSGASDDERIALLIRAGRSVSTTVIAPLPAIPNLETDVAALRSHLDDELLALRSIRTAAREVGATLSALTAFAPRIAAVDHAPFDLEPVRDQVLALAADLAQKARFLLDDITRRTTEAGEALTRAGTAATGDKAQSAALEAIQALLGSSFVLLPELTIDGERLAEWQNVWNHRADLLSHLGSGPDATSFPIDDWLHGVARVRQRLHDLELASVLGGALGATRPITLEALQFPHRPNDAWVALRFPETFPDGTPFELLEDKLCYTAVFGENAAVDPTQPEKTYSGLMLDEWIEVVPVDKETTGLAFHFDRPSSEAPQAILLVTPPEQRGAWRFDDLVATLHETLDFAKLRAVEPADLDRTALGPLIPALISAVTTYPITASLNLAFNNDLPQVLVQAPHE